MKIERVKGATKETKNSKSEAAPRHEIMMRSKGQ